MASPKLRSVPSVRTSKTKLTRAFDDSTIPSGVLGLGINGVAARLKIPPTIRSLVIGMVIVGIVVAPIRNADAATYNVLMLGNSFTFFSLPSIGEFIAEDPDNTVNLFSRTPGGETLLQHSETAASLNYISRTPPEMPSGSPAWDMIFLQDQSLTPAYAYRQYVQSGSSSSFAVWADQIVANSSGGSANTFWKGGTDISNAITTSAPTAKIVYLSHWARDLDEPSVLSLFPGATPLEQQGNMQLYTNRAIEAMQVRFAGSDIAYVGDTFHDWYTHGYDSFGGLYQSDNYHPNALGQYLAGSMIWSKITGKNPLDSTFVGGTSYASAYPLALSVAAASVEARWGIVPQTKVWNVDGSGNWGTGTNWSSSPAAPGNAPGAMVALINNVSVNTTVTIDSMSRTAGVFRIGDIDSTNTFTLASSGGGTLTMDNNGQGALIQKAGSKTDTISAPIVLADNLTIRAYDNLTISGNISQTGGTRSVTKSGTGALTLSGLNSYSGPTTMLDKGTLFVTQLANGGLASSVGASSNSAANLILANGTNLKFTGSTSATTDRGFTINGTADGDGASIDASGSGAGVVSFDNTVAIAWGTANQTRSLTLQGTNTGANTFGKVIANNGTGATSFVKNGSGRWVLDQANTYTGTTTLRQGYLVLAHATALPGGIGATGGTSPLIFDGGVLGLGAADFLRNLGSASTPAAVNFLASGGFAAYGADRNVNFGGDGHQIQWGAADTGFNGQVVILGAPTATHTVTITNGINLGSAGRTLDVQNGGASIDGSLGGVITGSAGAVLTKTGTGTLTLTNTNSYSGPTNVSAGTLEVMALANGGVNSTIGASSNAAANLVLGDTATLRYTGSANVATDRGFTINGAAAGDFVTIDASGAGTLSFSTPAASLAYGTADQTRTLVLSGTSTGANTFGKIIANNGTGATSLTKSAAGRWVLDQASTYTGVTSVTGGTLEVTVLANGGANSSIGASANVASNLLLSNGTTFRYAGSSNVTTDRGFTINATSNNQGATIESSGSGTLSFSTPGNPLAYGTVDRTRTLTLGGTNAGANTFGKIIANNGTSATSLVKSGTGRWVVDQNNTYTGSTTVNGGILEVASTGSINTSSSITVNAGGRLVYNSSTPLTRAPTLNGSGGSMAMLSGSGSMSVALTLNNRDDVLSPGNSPGELTFGVDQNWNSFTYAWEVNNWNTAVVGTTFDQIDILGSLTLSGNSYGVDLFSLTGLNAPGNLSNFSEIARSWTILTTTTGISGFQASEWQLDAAGFTAGSAPGGSWSLGLANGGNDLMLTYAPVPEPGTFALLGAGIGGIALGMRRCWQPKGSRSRRPPC